MWDETSAELNGLARGWRRCLRFTVARLGCRALSWRDFWLNLGFHWNIIMIWKAPRTGSRVSTFDLDLSRLYGSTLTDLQRRRRRQYRCCAVEGRRGFFTAEGFGLVRWASFRGRGLFFEVTVNRVDGLSTGSAGVRSGVSNLSCHGEAAIDGAKSS